MLLHTVWQLPLAVAGLCGGGDGSAAAAINPPRCVLCVKGRRLTKAPAMDDSGGPGHVQERVDVL
jgi:hypothetical protein